MKTTTGDFSQSARSVFARSAVAAIAMIALPHNGMAQFLFSGNSGYGYDNTKPIPGHPCHNKYHVIRQGSETENTKPGLYEQQNIIDRELDTTGSLPEDVIPSPRQCELLRELDASHNALIKSYLDEQACVASTGEPVLPELQVRLDDRYRRKARTERFLKLCPGGISGQAQQTRPKVGQAKRRQPAPE